jgi:uncharacterized membrane protein
MLRFSCPHCQKKLTGNDSLAGRNAKCPGCGHGLTVPSRPDGEGFKWYFTIDGKRFGPVGKSVLARLAAQKKLKPGDKVWSRPLGKQWVEAGRVPGLFSASIKPAVNAPSPAPFTSRKKTAAQERGQQAEGNALLMKKARESLKGHWGMAMVVLIMTWVISAIPVIGFFLAGPLAAGMSRFFLKLVRTGEGEVQNLFDKTDLFLPALVAMSWMGLIVAAAASVPALLAVNFIRTESPGLAEPCIFFAFLIVLYFQVLYAMTFFILADGRANGGIEAVRLSAKRMKTHFWKYAGLQGRFIGWMLLCGLTFGIGFLWVGPYMAASQAWFYEKIKE